MQHHLRIVSRFRITSRFAVGAVLASAVALAAVLPAQARTMTIAVAMKTQVQRRWGFDAAAMKREAEKLGVKLVFQWANDNPATQASQVENLLSQNPAALILVPVDTEASGSLVKSAHESNVPVVSYDVGITTAKPDYAVMRNNPLVGELQAHAALRMAPHGNYALMKGDPANYVAQAISKEYERILRPDKNIKIVFEQFIRNWDPKTALADAEDVLTAQNDHVSAFVTSNDGMATGVAQAIKSRNLSGKVFLSGLDADPANLRLIAEGVQTMTVWTDIVGEATSAVAAAVALAEHKKPDLKSTMINLGAGDVPTHLVSVVEINKGNLCTFITHDAPPGWVTVKDVFPNDANACK